MTRYRYILLLAFAAVWIWAAIDPVFRGDWLLENVLVFLFVPAILLAGVYFRLSSVSYTLITIFMILHVIGAHYTYERVPFGYTLQHWLGAERNMYDRLVHFSFGFLLAYPIREMFMRVSGARGIWSYFLPFDVTMSFSMVYELIEWAYAAMAGGEAGAAFLGTQGDEWDAQKDMAMATLGGLISMCTVALINWKFDRNFGEELRQSLSVADGDRPLGEVRLAEIRRQDERK